MTEDLEWLRDRIAALEKENAALRADKARLQEERDRKEEESIEWRAAAMIDVLTGLPNRRAFMQHLGELVETASTVPFWVLLVDMRDLKGINHRHGMVVADMVLKHLARVLYMTLRSDDTVFLARLGGDEFALVIQIPTEEPVTIRAIAERILSNATGTYRRRDNGDLIPVSVSIGGCCVSEQADAERVYNTAALNLEDAKEIHYKGEEATELPVVITT